MNAREIFTASQIGAALGRTGSAIRKRLAGIAAAGEVPALGGRALAWKIAHLPQPMRRELRATAADRGFRDVATLLTAVPVQWQPNLPLAQIAEPYVAKARQLREALAGTVRRLNDPHISAGELRTRGVAEYRAAFGHSI